MAQHVAEFQRPEAWAGHELIDCDVQVEQPTLAALQAYLPKRWADYVTESGVRSLVEKQYPARPGAGDLRESLLDPWATDIAIINCGYGIPSIHNDDWAAAMAAAVNDWLAQEWLSADSRLRGSLVVPAQNPELAAAEIDRMGEDRRFVQVLLPVRAEAPLGKRRYWPIYRAAEAHGLPIAVYPGGATGNPITASGWPSYYLEDYVGYSQAFQSQLLSLVSEGVFTAFPGLRVILLESGFTWLPSLLWRFDKNWKGLRREVPWVNQLPSEIITERVHITTAPLDAPRDPADLRRVLEHIDCDQLLLFATDHPHWHYDSGAESLPEGIGDDLLGKILAANARAVYRLEG